MKSGYHLSVNCREAENSTNTSTSFHPPDRVWKFIWNLQIPPKLKHFWWKACGNYLATKENLHRRKWNPSPSCPICKNYVESIEHILFGCKWTEAVWFGCNLTYKVDSLTISSVMKWTISIMENLDSAFDSSEILSKCVCVAWQIWKSRNDWVFNSVPVNPVDTVRKKIYNWEEIQGCLKAHGSGRSPETTNPIPQQWIPPKKGSFKANCDAAMEKGSNQVAIAAVIRDFRGRIIDGICNLVSASNVLQGEAMAIRLAGQILKANNIMGASIESDNQSMVKLCSTENVPPWDCLAIVEDICSLSSTIHNAFSWIHRNCNRVAHWVASSCLRKTILANWVGNPPPSLSSVCTSDASFEA